MINRVETVFIVLRDPVSRETQSRTVLAQG